jgi:hypothetical protein
LWRAEVYANEAGGLPTALEMVNKVRARAKNSVVKLDNGNPAANYLVNEYPAFADKDVAMKAIKRELRLEFGMEGDRFFDLVRWGDVATVMNKYLSETSMVHLSGKTFTVGRNEYWPVPQVQLDMSPGLEQIDEYK